ncbi:MAG: hypothetical protein JKY42_11120 [Flavobacteriales bacterium]|nr:hypothetical protein [Flavobacteriales bacterium]
MIDGYAQLMSEQIPASTNNSITSLENNAVLIIVLTSSTSPYSFAHI